jgi:hypothetical protein
MGTRRSKHNQGRKPRYKENGAEVSKAIWETPKFHKEPEPTVAEVLAKPAFKEFWAGGRYRLNQRLNWSEADKVRLQVLAKAGINPVLAADTLGREEKTIAYKARDLGVYIPPEWSVYLPKPKYVPHPLERRVLLNYPFAVKATAENEEVLAVNKLVPKAWSDEMRADVCQELMLHIYQGKITFETLHGPRGPELVRQYGRHWRNENMERGGYGMMRVHDLDDDRSYEDIAAAQCMKDYDWNVMNDRRAAWEAQSIAFTPATQEHDVWEKEIGRENIFLNNNGHTITYAETAKRMEEVGAESKWTSIVKDVERILYSVRKCRFTVLENKKQLHFRASASESQYIRFAIPDSNIGTLQIRVSNHPDSSSEIVAHLDTYKLGVDGVLRVLEELAGNREKYEEIHAKHNDFYDVMQEIAA